MSASVLATTPAWGAWQLFGGLGAGLLGVGGDSFRESPLGTQYWLGAAAALSKPRWVLDLGAGWSYGDVDGRDGFGRSARIRVRSGFAEVSPRLKLGSRWQLGPVAQVSFGTDTTYNPDVAGALGTAWAGLRGVYETRWGRFPFRVWQQAMTDVSVSGQQIWSGALGVQLGLSLEPRPEDSIRISAAAPLPPESERREVRIELDPARVFFGTASRQLRADALQALEELGSYLRSNPDAWQDVEVSGHADRRGRYEYNYRLSLQRALSVSQAIRKGSADRSRFKVSAHSYMDPLDPNWNPKAWARNRRAEIVLRGALATPELERLIQTLSRKKGSS